MFLLGHTICPNYKHFVNYCQPFHRLCNSVYSLFLISSTFTSTKMISGPIRMTLHHGIKNSQSLPKNPQNLAGPGTISALMHPVHSSSSRSITCPRQWQSQTLITSFSLNSHSLIFCPHTVLLYPLYA